MSIYQADDNNIQAFINRSGVVLISFWAPWCSSCRKLGPVLEEISCELAGKVLIAKVHVDQNPRSIDYYEIANVPTMLIFKDGCEVKMLTGLKAKEILIEWICYFQ